MKIIIFAGGTGKRFWPVSRIKSPKQFSPLIAGKPLVRLRVDALLKGFNASDIFLSTGRIYEDEVKKMLPQLPAENIILEPVMRDTGPAVTLAVNYVHSIHPGEVISIQWSDHLVKDETTFITALKESERVLQKESAKSTVFLTVPARFASPHRGYIEIGEKIKQVSGKITLYNFVRFKEKPSEKTAKKYIDSGNFGWNPGYWTIKPEYFLKIVNENAQLISKVCKEVVESNFSKDSLTKFSQLEKVAIDKVFAEKVNSTNALAMLTDIGWSDIGEWIALKEALQSSNTANVIKGNVVDLDSKDSVIFNLDNKKLVSTINLNGMVVVNTQDVVAVFHKKDNSRLKEYLANLENDGLKEYL